MKMNLILAHKKTNQANLLNFLIKLRMKLEGGVQMKGLGDQLPNFIFLKNVGHKDFSNFFFRLVCVFAG